MTWLRFTFVGLLFATPGEVLNQILARQNLHAFRSTMISYTVLLLIAYMVGKGLRKIHKRQELILPRSCGVLREAERHAALDALRRCGLLTAHMPSQSDAAADALPPHSKPLRVAPHKADDRLRACRFS